MRLSKSAISHHNTQYSSRKSIAHRIVKNRVGVAWVLPGLWQHPVVPVDVVRVEAELPSFQVLLNRGSDFMLEIGYATITSSDQHIFKYATATTLL